ncbi:endonuclease domain-containing 1 protein-like [Labeo rohita]|uniref:endonuclease domain-containing 1 protein-like n=1 Tax=Labeo rohita TaxID=84645 RepID=UPI0021E20EEB|nr:endonuclease domain-containing 1 protein-like [Labeo rohita]
MMLLLHVLMLSLLSGGSAEVVLHFKDVCDQFFANGKPPTGFSGVQYRKICQKQDNVYYFATFYDTSNRIPVYSAYVFQGIMGCKRLKNEKFWFIEPQLDDNNTSPNMQLNKDVSIQGLGNHQALNKDYVNSKYDRGHLAPVYQANSQSCAYATFTLTNGAPQNPSFNRVQWNTLEGRIARKLSNECKLPNKAYIVTGVVPGTENLNNRVNVPSHFWTAYCCLDNMNISLFSGGFIGKNEKNPPEEKTMNDLKSELANLYHVSSFELFSPAEHQAKKQRISQNYCFQKQCVIN